MARARVGYLLALIGAGAFFLFFNGFLSFYILVLAVVFPFFSLSVSLPAMLGSRTSFTPSSPSIRRGESLTLSLTVSNRWRLPLGRATARIDCVNLMTGQRAVFRRKGSGGSMGMTLSADLIEGHCGVLRCSVTSLKVCDLLGLFALSRPLPEQLELLSLPLDLPAGESDPLAGEGEGSAVLVPRPGGGPGEDYDLRPYRPGDPLRAVHWKLSAKADDLVVRETLEPLPLEIVLTYDHFGPMDGLDAVFDRLDALSRALISREQGHAIRWAHPLTGAVESKSVFSLKDLRSFEYAAFSIPAPMEGRSVLDKAGLEGGKRLRHLHITAGEGGEGA